MYDRPVRPGRVGMSIVATETLAALLDRAIDATQVMDVRNSVAPSPVVMDTYRLLLRSLRESYNPPAAEYVRLLKPVIQDADVKGQLTDVIRANLREYIHDDQIQSAVFAINGGATDGFGIDRLLEHWLDIAIARGSGYAAQTFLAGVNAPTVRYQNMTLLRGLRTDREIAVSNGIRLIPLPNTSTDLPHYMSELSGPMGPRPEDFLLDTILVVDASVSPVFINPTQTVGDGNEISDRSKVFQYEDASGENPGFDTEQFCEALSLIAGRPVQYAMWWSHLDDDHICKVRTSYGGFGYNQTALNHHSPDSGSGDVAEIVEEAMSLYLTRRGLAVKTAARLAVPIDRWIRSHTDTLIVDKFIDLGIALESLYLNDGNTSELRFRLALHAAWHLGSCGSERSRMLHEFRTMYDLRSRAVHTGAIDDTQSTRDSIARAQEHCRQAIIKFTGDGVFRDWDRLVVN